MTRLALILACLATAAACPPGAPMAPRADVVPRLADGFAETQRSFALGKKTVVEVFASGAGTFTILETNAAGMSCIIAAGTRWRNATPSKSGEPT